MVYTILKRIAQAFILLSFTLCIVIGVSCFFPAEAEAEKGNGTNGIKVSGLVWELVSIDDWKLPFRNGSFPEISEDEKVVLNEEYAEIYYHFLRECYEDNPYKESIPMGFCLVYIDGDDIPELLVMKDDSHAAGVWVYTYYGGRMIEVGEFGSFGYMQYLEKEGRIFSAFTGQGASYSDFLELEKGELKEICRLFCYPEHDNPLEDLYEIDDVTVSEAVFDAKWQELWSDEYMLMGYKDAVFFTERNLRTLLAQEIERLKGENH